jgi:hypothetical protein
MSDSSSNTAGGGIGLFGVIFVVFLVMKLMEIDPVASWSWWWVTAPLWVPWAFILGVMILFGVVWVVFTVCRVILAAILNRN